MSTYSIAMWNSSESRQEVKKFEWVNYVEKAIPLKWWKKG